ncbi:MAG TPA: hypothetical protein PKH24_20705 [Sedimentisphaerales bacterium]|jgi:hypothetical protein|nr:hypothetical protein [Sedimentisphaerales bacterium]HNU31623.1 hypothetical protein [Sedimentisphaerales bacterium]
MSSADKMRRLFDEGVVQTNAAPDDAVFEKIKTTYMRAVQHKSAQQEPGMWRSIMKSPLAKLAVAVAVLIACAIGLFLWRTTGSGIALADVLARVEQVRAFQCKGIIKRTSESPAGKPHVWEVHSINLESKECGSKATHKEIDPNGARTSFAETYFVPTKKILIYINHIEKRYIRTELDDWVVPLMQKEFLGRYSNPGTFLKEIVACKYESTGRSTVDGIDVEGFRTTDPNCARDGGSGFTDPQIDVKVWIDAKTRLPVRYESLTSGLDEKGADASHQFVVYDFQWDVAVDVAEFESPAIPDGYTVQVEKPWGAIDEQTATESLRKCAELFGKYLESPGFGPSVDLEGELNKSNNPAAIRLKEELKGLAGLERANRLADAALPMRRLLLFYMNLTNEKKDPAYYGKTITPKDADKVLLRWKLSDMEYRVIFGDLHAETVSPEKLAELEKTLPK